MLRVTSCPFLWRMKRPISLETPTCRISLSNSHAVHPGLRDRCNLFLFKTLISGLVIKIMMLRKKFRRICVLKSHVMKKTREILTRLNHRVSTEKMRHALVIFMDGIRTNKFISSNYIVL